MRFRWITISSLALLIVSCFLTPSALASTYSSHTTKQQRSSMAATDFPAVNPRYMYDQLYTMVARYPRRESGYDTLADHGHAGFADYWSQEIARDLQGFGPQITKDPFTIKGWAQRPATTQAYNVEVSIPGATHPEQVVVIGCHYDGEAFSTQSANDDGSGCAIELGVAQALGTYWRSHHLYPARTLRFVIFDAEEQGLLGSFHYLNATVNGDVRNIVAMFNEEQSGIAYPLRYLGQLKNPQLPFYIEMSPLKNTNFFYPHQAALSSTQKQNITNFQNLIRQAIDPVFAEFRALGYQELTYHDNNKQDVPQPIFTSAQKNMIHPEEDQLGSSDQVPFTKAGVPCATFVGNASYYDNNPPPWSYPYDQPQDTIQLMNTFADGNSTASNALALSLALPGMFTTWMLHQPAILGETATPQAPLATMSDIGTTQIGHGLRIDAKASFDPQHAHAALSYTWNFGDGSQAQGSTTTHTYTKTGTYTLTLTTHSTAGNTTTSKIVTVLSQPTSYDNPYTKYIDFNNGRPPHNAKVIFPAPDGTLTDKVLPKTIFQATLIPVDQSATQHAHTGMPLALIALIGVALVVIIIGLVGGILLYTRKAAKKSGTS